MLRSLCNEIWKSKDEGVAAKLWDVSEGLTCVDYNN